MKKIVSLLLFSWITFGLFAQNDSIPMESSEIISDSIVLDSVTPDIPENTTVETPVEEVVVEEAEVDLNTPSPEAPEPFYWDVASIDGKLKMKGLPLSPSLKIFMVKDALISISVRAPFVGEAVRITLTPDSVLAVNKMKKTYAKESIADFLRYYPGDLADVQDLLLARFFVPGFDVAESDLNELVDIFYQDNQFNVVPKGEAVISGIDYGYIIDQAFNPLVLMVLPQARPDIQIAAFYRYNLTGYDLQLAYQEGEKAMDLTLELKNPVFSGEMPAPIELNNKYKQLPFSDFIRNF